MGKKELNIRQLMAKMHLLIGSIVLQFIILWSQFNSSKYPLQLNSFSAIIDNCLNGSSFSPLQNMSIDVCVYFSMFLALLSNPTSPLPVVHYRVPLQCQQKQNENGNKIIISILFLQLSWPTISCFWCFW